MSYKKTITTAAESVNCQPLAFDKAPPTDTSFDPAVLDYGTTSNTNAGPDPFDPASLRLSGDFSASLGVKKVLLKVPVRKPDKSWFVRVHPDEGYRIATAVIELKDDRDETYLVAPALRPQLATESTFNPKLIATVINLQGTRFLWSVNMPRSDGRSDEWSKTALEAVNMASKGWIRTAANMSLGAFEVFQASAIFPNRNSPKLPSVTCFASRSRIGSSTRWIIRFYDACGVRCNLTSLFPYRQTWSVDFEFMAPPGELRNQLADALRNVELLRRILRISKKAEENRQCDRRLGLQPREQTEAK